MEAVFQFIITTIFKGNLHKKDLLAYFKVSDVFTGKVENLHTMYM